MFCFGLFWVVKLVVMVCGIRMFWKCRESDGIESFVLRSVSLWCFNFFVLLWC